DVEGGGGGKAVVRYQRVVDQGRRKEDPGRPNNGRGIVAQRKAEDWSDSVESKIQSRSILRHGPRDQDEPEDGHAHAEGEGEGEEDARAAGEEDDDAEGHGDLEERENREPDGLHACQ